MSVKKLYFHGLPIVIVLVSILFAYAHLPGTFFQQDEWIVLAGNIYSLGKGFSSVAGSFFPVDPIAHFSPLARAFSWFQYSVLYTNFPLHAWLSILLHSMNASLLYYFVYIIIRKRSIALIVGLLFAVNSIASQAVTWVAAVDSFEITTLFLLLSLFFFFRFVIQKTHEKKNLIWSLALLFLSLLFHETGLFFFLFYPLALFLYKKPRRKKAMFSLLSGLVILALIFIFIRIPFFFGISNPLPAVTDTTHPPLFIYPFRLFSISMKSFAQTFFSQNYLIAISDTVVKLAYPQFVTPDNAANPYISQSIVFDLASYFISIMFVGTILVLRKWKTFKEKKYPSWIISWSLVFIPLSLFPYALISGKAGYTSILEPKFFYITSMGSSLLLAVIIDLFLLHFSKSVLKKGIILFFLSFYFLFNIFTIRADVKRLEKIGTLRKSFLEQIKLSYQNLPKDVIFYTASSSPYYGMPDNEKILPVEIGFGKILMIWYQADEHFPTCMYENQFLLDILAVGFRKCDGRGFGYFRSLDTVKKALKENNLSPASVIAYSWDGKTETFKDITKNVREKLQKEL